MIKFLKNHWEVLVIFLLSLTPLLWLKDNQVILVHDSGFRPDSLTHLINLFYSWMPIPNFGFDWSIFKGFLITQLPETIFILLTGSLHYGQILTFIFWFFLIGLSMYIFTYSLFPQKELWVFRLFSSTFYMYNFFLLQGWFIAERAKFSLFAALPLGLLVIYKTLTRQYSILKGSILFSFIFFFFNGGGFPSLYGGIILVYSSAFLYLTIISVIKYGYKELLRIFATGISFTLTMLLINAYWIFPQIYLFKNTFTAGLSTQGGIEGIVAWEAVISKSASLLNLFRLQGVPDWYDNPSHPYASYFLERPLLIIASLVFIGIVLGGFYHYETFKSNYKNNAIVYLMLLLLLVGIMFTAGTHPPFGKLYLFLVENLPGFVIFRSSFYKFGPALLFPMAFLSGYFLNLLLLKFVKKKEYAFLPGAFAILFILFYHFPFFTKNIFEWNKPFTTRVQIPQYAQAMSFYINTHVPSSSRILLLPQLHPYFKADSYEWGFWSLWPLPHTLMNRVFVTNDSSGEQEPAAKIYQSLSNNDTNLFLHLIGAAGIDKILWRDDVLYSNKVVESKDLAHVRNTLLNMPGIALEKRYGKWELYSINNPYYLPLFYVPDTLTYLHSDVSLEKTFSAGNVSSRYSSLFSSIGNDTILPQANTELIQATCVSCREDELLKIQSQVRLPEVNLLPDSLFYFISAYKDRQLRKQEKESIEKNIDIKLTLANKRIAEEILLFEKGHNENTGRLHERISGEYKNLIKTILQGREKLSLIPRNYYGMKVLAYLNAHQEYLSNNKEIIPSPVFADLSMFLEQNISLLQNSTWVTTSPTSKRYFLSVQHPGNYSMRTVSNNTFRAKIIFDGTEIANFKNIFIPSGIHKLELQYPEPKNLLTVRRQEDREKINLKFTEKIEYGISNFNPNTAYMIGFRYKKTMGIIPPTFSAVQWKEQGGRKVVANRAEAGLSTHTYWHTFYFMLVPDPGVKSASLYFTNFSNDEAGLEIEDFKVYSVNDPAVFLERKLLVQTTYLPQISFQKINPTKYIVSIKDAKTPFFLNFDEAYNSGWKAYLKNEVFTSTRENREVYDTYYSGDIIEFLPRKSFFDNTILASAFAKKIPEANHFKVNGYANGWFVDKQGTYDLIIEYTPQRLVYIGGFLTVVTFASFSIVLLHIRKKHAK